MTHAPQKSSPGVRLGVEYGPLLVFFAVNFLFPAALAIRLVGFHALFIHKVGVGFIGIAACGFALRSLIFFG